MLKKEKNYLAHLLAKTTHSTVALHERFVFAQSDSSQEFLEGSQEVLQF